MTNACTCPPLVSRPWIRATSPLCPVHGDPRDTSVGLSEPQQRVQTATTVSDTVAAIEAALREPVLLKLREALAYLQAAVRTLEDGS